MPAACPSPTSRRRWRRCARWGPPGHFLGTQHTLEHFEKAFFIPSIMDFNSFEQWQAEGAKDHDTRGREKARAMLDGL